MATNSFHPNPKAQQLNQKTSQGNIYVFSKLNVTYDQDPIGNDGQLGRFKNGITWAEFTTGWNLVNTLWLDGTFKNACNNPTEGVVTGQVNVSFFNSAVVAIPYTITYHSTWDTFKIDITPSNAVVPQNVTRYSQFWKLNAPTVLNGRSFNNDYFSYRNFTLFNGSWTDFRANARIEELFYTLIPISRGNLMTENFELTKENVDRFVTVYGKFSDDTLSAFYASQSDTMANWFFGSYINPSMGPDSEAGGFDGDFDNYTESIDFPDLPTYDIINKGLLNMYNLGNGTNASAKLEQLSDFLYSRWNEIAEQFSKIFNDPMENFISLSFIPVAPPSSDLEYQVRFGNQKAYYENEGSINYITSKVVTNQFYTFDCGSIRLKEYFGTALDYEPYTSLQIFLPFIGYQTLSIDDCMDSTMHLKYNIDFLTGSCVAFLKITKNTKINLDAVCYSWSGNMNISIPISGSDMASKFSTLISASIGVGITAATGGSGAMIAAGVAGGAMSTATTKPSVQRGGTLSMWSGALGDLTPYLILTRPIQSKAKNFEKLNGLPSNLYATVGQLKGYTEFTEIHIDRITATEEEKQMIEDICKSGIII